MVIWIIGKSGSGKTFWAKKLIKRYKDRYQTFHVDGDEFRKYITNDIGYSIKERSKNSLLIQKFCKYLEFKGYFVVCSILSIFPKHQKLNRKIFSKYIQIEIECETGKILKRNNKCIYSIKKNVVGKDIKYPKPYKSNLKIFNDFTNCNIRKNINKMTNIINYEIYK